MGASKTALILMKNSHFDRTLQYVFSSSCSDRLLVHFIDYLTLSMTLDLPTNKSNVHGMHQRQARGYPLARPWVYVHSFFFIRIIFIRIKTHIPQKK